MKAIVVQEDKRHSLSWREVPDPICGPEEVVLRVRATAVNRADLLQRAGKYPPPPGAPAWMGLEAAGEIESIGAEVTGWSLGAGAACLVAGGGYAERLVVQRDLLMPIPRGLSMEEAASLPEAFATAWLNLMVEGSLAPAETVLVHAGASGVGLAAIQVAKLRGAHVMTTVGSAEKAERVRAFGADQVIVHSRENVTDRMAALARERVPGGIDLVLDCLGGEEIEHHLPMLNPGGRWIVIALMKGRFTALDLAPLLARRLRLIGSTLRSRPVVEKGAILRALEREVWPAIESGRVRTFVHAVLPIEEAERAHAILEAKENLGKVVLRVD
ncbi:MAG: NAD(P)H-quinone oxidoreductase [Candidatus Eisenbacteria bacterium]